MLQLCENMQVWAELGFEVTEGIAMNAGVQYYIVDSTKYATIASY